MTSMDISPKLARMLAFKHSIKEHLFNLSQLLGRPVSKTELLGLSETEQLRKFVAEKNLDYSVIEYDFEMLYSREFSEFIGELDRRTRYSLVNLWIPTTFDCGLIAPLKFSSISLHFNFNFIADGMLTIETVEHDNRMSLDWFEERGRRLLEIELSGDKWKGLKL